MKGCETCIHDDDRFSAECEDCYDFSNWREKVVVETEPSPTPALASAMTLRQWYAGMAMQGMLANPDTDWSVGSAASCAFEVADAMIAAESTSDTEDTNG